MWNVKVFYVKCVIRMVFETSRTFNVLVVTLNPLNAELNPICYLLALLELTIFSTLAG